MNNTVFLVVIDPAIDTQPALERAIQSAEFTEGRLHLLKSVYDPSAKDDKEQQKKLIREAGNKTLALAQNVVDAGLEVSIEVVWNENWGEAIIESAKRNSAFMIFKSSYIHNLAQRNEDTLEWQLLRESPCPVLIMHDNSKWDNRRILAAIDIATKDELHQKLNQDIINTALAFKQDYGSELHVVNAKPKSPAATNKSSDDEDIIFGSNLIPGAQKTEEAIEITPESISQLCNDLPTEYIHIGEGRPDDVILNTADAMDIDLIIVGTVCRTGIKGRVIGNMPEKLLDRTKCDILSLSALS